MTREEANSVLECMAIDMVGAMSEMRKTNPMLDVLQQRVNAINIAQSALRGPTLGMIGEAGYVEPGDVIKRAKESVMHYETITDVDGNVWRPVLEDSLKFLIQCMTERAEKAEVERDAAIRDLEDLMLCSVSGCDMCANAITVQREPCVRLDCALKDKQCTPKWRGAKEE